jgi:hypothetical protein
MGGSGFVLGAAAAKQVEEFLRHGKLSN